MRFSKRTKSKMRVEKSFSFINAILVGQERHEVILMSWYTGNELSKFQEDLGRILKVNCKCEASVTFGAWDSGE